MTKTQMTTYIIAPLILLVVIESIFLFYPILLRDKKDTTPLGDKKNTLIPSFSFKLLDKTPTYDIQEEVPGGHRVRIYYKIENKNLYDIAYRIVWKLVPENTDKKFDLAEDKFWALPIEKVAGLTSATSSIGHLAGKSSIDDWLNNKRSLLLIITVSVWKISGTTPNAEEHHNYKLTYSANGTAEWEDVPQEKLENLVKQSPIAIIDNQDKKNQ